MRLLLASVLLFAFALSATAADWPAGTFLINWPSGYGLVAKPHLDKPPGPNSSITQLKSRDGTLVTIEVIGHGPLDPAGEQKIAQDWLVYGRSELKVGATRSGFVAVPLSEERLASGDTLFSTGWDKTEGELQRFGLLFLEISPKGRAAQIVVQGPGLARSAYGRFKRIVATARWSD